MALQPLPPIPNTRLVDDPARDAIWRRYLEQVFALLSQVNNTGVVGPGSSTDNAVARWNGTTGQTLQNSGVIIDDSNSVSGVSSFTAVQITDSALTAGRVVYAGTGGLLSDNAALAYAVATSTLTATNISSVTGVFDNVSTRTLFATSSVTFNSLTATRVPFAGTSGLLTDSADLTYTTGTSTFAVAGIVSLPDGTAAAPSLKIGDEQNGFYSPSANTINATLNGISRTSFNTAGVETSVASAGVQIRHTVTNTNNSNTTSHARFTATTGGSASGDPFSQYIVTGGSSWSAGLDNSDSDSYKISQGTALGTNDYLTITTGGVVGLPTVNIDGGNIDSTAIGATTASTGVFTNVSTGTLFSSGLTTLATVNIDGGNIDGTAIGAATASTGVFTNISTTAFFTSTSVFDNVSTRTIFATSTATFPLVNIDGGFIDSTAIGANTASTGVYTNVSTTTLFSTSTATLPLVNIDGGNIDSTAIGANTASTGVFTNVSTGTLFTSGNATIGDAAADTLTINAESVTQPNIPCFLAYNSASDTNQTGAGAVATVDFNTEVIDQSGDFASDTFTASITGTYHLGTFVRFDSVPAGSTGFIVAIITSNRNYTRDEIMVAGTFSRIVLCISTIADMDAGDTATVTVQITGGAGNTATITGAANPQTFFYGKLAT